MKNFEKKNKVGKEIYNWATKIINHNRSITGKGTLETLKFIKSVNTDIKIKFSSSRKKVFDWIIPDEWHVQEAYIEDNNKKRIIDFKNNNLHVLNYSISVNKRLRLKWKDTPSNLTINKLKSEMPKKNKKLF